MNLKLSIIFGLVYLVSNSVFSADSTKSILLSKVKNSVETPDYWTEEKIKHAQPIVVSMPKNLLPHEDKIRLPTKFSEGSPPKIFNNSLTERLISADTDTMLLNQTRSTDNNFKLTDSGTLRMHFTSSRLVPRMINTVYPYVTIGKLYFTIPNKGDFVCSASVLRQRIIFTAGHCVHSGLNGKDGFYQNFMFIPAYREGVAPIGRWHANYVAVHAEWANGGGIIPNEADFGMIELKDRTINGVKERISTFTGFLGYQTESLDRNHAHLIGYPCNLDRCQEMHQVIGETGRTVTAKNVEYGSDMRDGSDGSPWIQNFGEYGNGQDEGLNPGINRVIGVASYFYMDASKLAQGGSGLDNRFLTLLNKVCAHKSDNCN